MSGRKAAARDALLEAAKELDVLQRIAKTPIREISDEEVDHYHRSGLMFNGNSMASFARWLRDRAEGAS